MIKGFHPFLWTRKVNLRRSFILGVSRTPLFLGKAYSLKALTAVPLPSQASAISFKVNPPMRSIAFLFCRLPMVSFLAPRLVIFMASMISRPKQFLLFHQMCSRISAFTRFLISTDVPRYLSDLSPYPTRFWSLRSRRSSWLVSIDIDTKIEDSQSIWNLTSDLIVGSIAMLNLKFIFFCSTKKTVKFFFNLWQLQN